MSAKGRLTGHNAADHIRKSDAITMSSLIIRIYDNYGDALDAANELEKNRFGSRATSLISVARNSDSGEISDTALALKKLGIPEPDIAAYAEVVGQGKSVLAVRAVLGAAAKAIKIMKRHNPIHAGIGWKEYAMAMSEKKTLTYSSAAPLSSALGWPVLLNDPAPFSRFFNWPTLLSNAAPLSSWLNFPTLLGASKSPYTFGEPKLLKDGAEFSHKLNLPVLTDEPKDHAP